ncbi:hypothetical protein AcV7_009786 [Taiwanofungus camphoratus]|nr:hypothetical protein AcV7_009786 [Antrodia cinnamomea]
MQFACLAIYPPGSVMQTLVTRTEGCDPSESAMASAAWTDGSNRVVWSSHVTAPKYCKLSRRNGYSESLGKPILDLIVC